MKNKMRLLQQYRNHAITCAVLAVCAARGVGAEYHVSVSGNDVNSGAVASPFKTISKAGGQAQPGDVITVHEGVYRERINPPRGGISDEMRIVYQAAPGEKVVIKGSERVIGWQKVEGDVWKITLPNDFFGAFNPYRDLIRGDWYEATQPYHTGAVYLNGHWLREAARKSDVVKSLSSNDQDSNKQELMNLESLHPEGAACVQASRFSAKSGVAKVSESPGGKSGVGRMKDGDWLAYDGVECGSGTGFLTLSIASPAGGGLVEIRKDDAQGELLGTCRPNVTAEWTHFQPFRAAITRVSGKQKIVLVFRDVPRAPVGNGNDSGSWFAGVDADTTTIWAQFKVLDPNQALVEINVRQAVFYPDQPGRNYITVRGFTLEQAATPWSPPTAEQVGLLGTHWSKGWLIEDNTIRYSTCAGVTLGKHGDEFDNTMNYNRSIRVALQRGWSRNSIGSHVVRNNHIYHCGQGGIIGSLGCSFSTITGNEIHEIRQHHQYGGCETAGIKLHGALDVVISNNHIYRCAHWGGIWLDWMGQGARLTGNLLHDNSNDMMFEMNHGPMLIDNNILLSNHGVLDASGGGAYVHNLIGGALSIWSDLTKRQTPVFKPHTADLKTAKADFMIMTDEARAALLDRWGGVGVTVDQHDDRFLNNLFTKAKALSAYDEHKFRITAAGNVFLAGAKPSEQDKNPVIAEAFDPGIRLVGKSDGWWLEMNVDPAWQEKVKRDFVTTELLGQAQVPNAPFEHPDGTPYRIDTDYFGAKRQVDQPAPGPFQMTSERVLNIKVWPKLTKENR